MAAHSSNFIRVRLLFDYPPPAVIDCRLCWLLVDLNKCRVVADLESVIREKFEFSSRSILNLYVEDCYLPHTECIFVVRDNDSVRVKVSYQAQVNKHSSDQETLSKNCRKRQRPTEEDGQEENGVSVERKEKKKKKRTEVSLEVDDKQGSGDGGKKKKSHKEKKKKKMVEIKSPAAAPTSKPAASAKKSVEPVKSPKKPPATQTKTQSKKCVSLSSSDSSSSSSEEDEAPKKPSAKKAPPKTLQSTSAASKPPPAVNHVKTKPRPEPSSSSSETDSSSSDEAQIPLKNKPLPPKIVKLNNTSESQQQPLQNASCAQIQVASVAPPPGAGNATEARDSDEEEEIKFVIKRPTQPPGFGLSGGRSPWRGGGRGGAKRGGREDRGRGQGRGVNGGYNGYSELRNGVKEPSYETDSLTNKSVVLQNGEGSAPKRDYSSLPLLAAPPQVGQKIAFRLLELNENYSPEVSEYKEGKIVNFDPTTKQIELELLHTFHAPVEPGKFDLVYQNPDGSETVEYAVSRSSRVTEQWDSLLEPRLII